MSKTSKEGESEAAARPACKQVVGSVHRRQHDGEAGNPQ
jgi:hypothetical protein